MSNIQTYLQKILSARYGKDVRQSIHDAIEEVDRVADTAQGSATEAAEQAKSSASSALSSAQKAAVSESNAKKSETNAAGSESNVANNAERASNSASSAANSAVQAQESASSAANSATGAASSASSATSSAKIASASATDAANSALQAQESASHVQNYAEEAQHQASIARESAESAKTYRDEAMAVSPQGYENLVQNVNDNTVKIDTIIEKAVLNMKNTASGESIHLTDSSVGKVDEFALYGKAKQYTTTGKNILKLETKSGSQYGINYTINKEGIIEFSGGPSTAAVGIGIGEITLPNGKYIITTGTDGTNLCLMIKINGANTLIKKTYTLVVNSETTYLLSYYIQNKGFTPTVGNDKLYPMIRKCDESGNPIGDDTFEAYTGGIPSPNPEYPQEIKVSGADGSVEVKSTDEQGNETTAILSTPSGLAGIPVSSDGNYTDETGQQWICDEIVKYADGTGEKIQRIKKFTFDGSETWTKSSVDNTFYNQQKVADGILNNQIIIMCNSYIGSIDFISQMQYKRIRYGLSTSNAPIIYIKDSSYSTTNELKAALSENNIYGYYPLEKPIRTPLTAEEITEIEKLHTFYPVTNITNDSDCGMKVTYQVDSKNYIDNQLALQTQAQEAAMINMLLLLPEETQAAMIENDTNNLLLEREE